MYCCHLWLNPMVMGISRYVVPSLNASDTGLSPCFKGDIFLPVLKICSHPTPYIPRGPSPSQAPPVPPFMPPFSSAYHTHSEPASPSYKGNNLLSNCSPPLVSLLSLSLKKFEIIIHIFILTPLYPHIMAPAHRTVLPRG